MTEELESKRKIIDKAGPFGVLTLVVIGLIWPLLWGMGGMLACHLHNSFGFDHRIFAITWVVFLILPALFLFAISSWWRRRALVVAGLSAVCILFFTQLTQGALGCFYIHMYNEIFTPNLPGLSDWFI
jgi:hypothetical protein